MSHTQRLHTHNHTQHQQQTIQDADIPARSARRPVAAKKARKRRHAYSAIQQHPRITTRSAQSRAVAPRSPRDR
eukprot:scaffold58302_cov72-Phaeocystis_antarctica.AAC.6